MDDMTGHDAVRFAVVGCGMLAQSQHLPNIAASRKAVLQAVCDVNEDTARECGTRFGAPLVFHDYHTAIAHPEVDAICLATTEKLRLPVIEAAAAAGKPVYSEKPMARTLDEARAIRRTVETAGIPYCVGHNRRSSPAMLEAHRIFRRHMEHPLPCPWRYEREGALRPSLPEEGVAGMCVRINDDWHSWKRWVFDKQQAPYGPMLFEMTHFTDLCNWLLAAEPAEVAALESGMLNSGVSIRYQTGEVAVIMMSANGTFGYGKELYELMGNGGFLAVDHMVEIRTAGIEGAPASRAFPLLHDRNPEIGTEGGMAGWLAKKRAACAEAAAAGNPALIFTAEPDKGHAAMIDRFCDQIRGRGPEVCGARDALLATQVAMAAIRSAAERRAIAIEEV